MLGLREATERVTADNPCALWNAVYEREGLAKPKRGPEMCGFKSKSLRKLIDVHTMSGTNFAAIKSFDEMSDRWKRHLAELVSAEFSKAMSAVCPDNPAMAFKALRESASWLAKWCNDDTGYEDILDLPFVKGMADAYAHAPIESKMAILSLFAPYFPVSVTRKFFNVEGHVVTAAKIHAANAMAGQPLSKVVHERMRLSPRTFAFLHSWCRSTFAVSAGDASSADLNRLQIRTRLYKRYKVMANSEIGTKAVEKDHFMKHMRDGFMDESVESCCCGGCVDGWTALDQLREFVNDPEYEFPDRKKLTERVDAILEFFKGDYRWKHLKEQSHETMHCMQHSLGGDCASLCEQCEHEHVNTCVECNMLPSLMCELKAHIADFAKRRQSYITRHCGVCAVWDAWHERNDWKICGREKLPEGILFDSEEYCE
jgi:hypothetical protein